MDKSKSPPLNIKTGAMDQPSRTTPSAISPTETSSSSGTKRKREKDPKFYAVKTGFKPGVYKTWAECLAQIKGFKAATFQSFPSMREAEDFMAGKKSTVSAGAISGEPQKFYAVASGRIPGVYTDWPTAQQQIVGWARPKHRKFSTRAEAEDFVKQSQKVLNAAEKDENAHKADGTVHEAKKRKTDPGIIPGFINGEPRDADGVVLEPGTGPLPPGAEDGFDPNILLDPKTGKVVHKTVEQKNATKTSKNSSVGMLNIYTDGSSIKNGKEGAHAGVGVYFGDGDKRNVSETLKGARQTNQRAELTAIQRALDIAPRHRDVTIHTDSKYSIDCLTNWFINWRKNGWMTAAKKPVENKDLVEATLAKIEEREVLKVKTLFVWVKGHNSDPGNTAADKLAVEGAKNGK